ncbi:50S ribosomal protein L25 [bacterium]|nr:50S ribosomal protein L25 [bacterium]
MEELLFHAQLRENKGTGAARKTRLEGFIPGILYGAGHSPCSIKLERKTTERIIRQLASHNVIASLVIEQNGNEEKIKTMLKDVQIQPIKGNVLHLDFYRIRMDKPIRMQVPIQLNGEAPGLELGGIMEHELREIEIQALPGNMPELIEIDISSMQIGDTVLVKDIQLGDDVEIIDSLDRSIISIMAPRVAKEEEETDEELEEALPEQQEGATEPEVISQQKAEERRKDKDSPDKK